MTEKPSYKELEKRLQELEKKVASNKDAKKTLQIPARKPSCNGDEMLTSEMALEIMDTDVPEKKPVKHALMAEHIFRKTIEQAIPCGITEVDLEGRIIYVNRFFCNMIGEYEIQL